MAGIAAILNRGRSVVDGQKKSGVGKKLGIGCLAVIGAFVGLVIGAIVGDKTTNKQSTLATASEAPGITKVETAAEPTTSLTGPQINAARSAKDYLEMSGFSRAGLIQQLVFRWQRICSGRCDSGGRQPECRLERTSGTFRQRISRNVGLLLQGVDQSTLFKRRIALYCCAGHIWCKTSWSLLIGN
jgi:hypothetical protein